MRARALVSSICEKSWVKEEASFGKKHKILVPVKIDAVELPLGFGLIQAADLIEWLAEEEHPGFISLIRAISGIAGPSPLKVEEAEQQRSEEKQRKKVETQQQNEAAQKALEMKRIRQTSEARRKAAEERQREEEYEMYLQQQIEDQREAERRYFESLPIPDELQPDEMSPEEYAELNATPITEEELFRQIQEDEREESNNIL